MLKIQDLHVALEESGDPILKGLSLEVAPGEVHAVMGPNGSGKSTLSYVLAGRDGYEVSAGSVEFDGQDLLQMEAEERAAAGFFLAFQTPVGIPGVNNMVFLRTALNAQRRARGEADISAPDFLREARKVAGELGISSELMKRSVNVDFSGGERKRNEIMQMTMLAPRLCVLDETDSGLDVDAMRQVAVGVNALRAPDRSFIIITHYQRLLDHIKPDVVHILSDGKFVETGGPDLALRVETEGYSLLAPMAAAGAAS